MAVPYSACTAVPCGVQLYSTHGTAVQYSCTVEVSIYYGCSKFAFYVIYSYTFKFTTSEFWYTLGTQTVIPRLGRVQ